VDCTRERVLVAIILIILVLLTDKLTPNAFSPYTLHNKGKRNCCYDNGCRGLIACCTCWVATWPQEMQPFT